MPDRQLLQATDSSPVSAATKYFPPAHPVQLSAPESAYLPAPQLAQFAEEGDDAYFPFEQNAHALASTPVAAPTRYLPATHPVQEDEKVPLYWPVGQSVHVDAPRVPLYLPDGQASHIESRNLQEMPQSRLWSVDVDVAGVQSFKLSSFPVQSTESQWTRVELEASSVLPGAITELAETAYPSSAPS